ncbi:MAG: redox-sensing transcriptional repressor Rex [Candidatus Delongbacteria bacterium]|nr:redox-sensing transcriptional repressor Rex [Candidatus Delongbacteria bacterium]MBN2836758.1 redox-sensing transcriptional repressor Rex [Candidatus Delongbacteria bacterium]
MELINEKTIERLSLYRRLLKQVQEKGIKYFYSHELAKMAHLTPVQIRRDLMNIGYNGNNRKGYETDRIIECISGTLDSENGEKVAIAGVGRLGTALLKYFIAKNNKIEIKALFDINPDIVGTKIDDIECFHVNEIEQVIASNDIKTGIIASTPESAMSIAKDMISGGVKSIINFTPVPLDIPEDIFLEEIDITVSIEKAAYFAKGKANSVKKILLIDDDPDFINAYKAILKNEGYEILTAFSSNQGLIKIREHLPNLVILDIMMENADSGFTLLKQLQNEELEIPVILSSSIADAARSLMDDFSSTVKTILQKPVDLDLLVKTVKKYL